jgi:FtsZ-interacting cell division protein YlmF
MLTAADRKLIPQLSAWSYADEEYSKAKNEAEKRKNEAEKNEAEKKKNEAEKKKNEAEKKMVEILTENNYSTNVIPSVLRLLQTYSVDFKEGKSFSDIHSSRTPIKAEITEKGFAVPFMFR